MRLPDDVAALAISYKTPIYVDMTSINYRYCLRVEWLTTQFSTNPHSPVIATRDFQQALLTLEDFDPMDYMGGVAWCQVCDRGLAYEILDSWVKDVKTRFPALELIHHEFIYEEQHE